MLRRLGTNSAIYTATNFVQKGAIILLMPLYTRYLDPTAYGILAIVTAVNGFLSLAFTLNLTAAITRFYFEFRDDPETMGEFWGSVFSFVMLLSAASGVLLVIVGKVVLRPLLGDVPFWPYVALGVITTFFQPLFTTYLSLLQTRHQARQYALLSLSHFALTTVLTILLVIFLRQGAEGALTAVLAATATFFALSVWLLRSELRFGLSWRHLRSALGYSLPQIPHLLACQTTAIADRLILNARLGAAAAGLYSVGGMVSMVVEVVAASVNRAYVPISMGALQSRDSLELSQLRAVGSLIVAGFCLIGAAIGAFAAEIVRVIAAPSFQAAASVVPVMIFGGVAGAIYYLFVNVLIFDRSAVKFLPIGTLTAAALNVTLALILISRFGLIGAAAAYLAAQVVSTVLIGAIAHRFEPVRWDYGRYAAAFFCGLISSLLLSGLHGGGFVIQGLLKLAGLMILAVLLGLILWRRPLILAEAAVQLLRRRPSEAAALFLTAEIAT